MQREEAGTSEQGPRSSNSLQAQPMYAVPTSPLSKRVKMASPSQRVSPSQSCSGSSRTSGSGSSSSSSAQPQSSSSSSGSSSAPEPSPSLSSPDPSPSQPPEGSGGGSSGAGNHRDAHTPNSSADSSILSQCSSSLSHCHKARMLDSSASFGEKAPTVSTPPPTMNSSTLSTPPLMIDLTEEASAASVSLLDDSAKEKLDGNRDPAGAGKKPFEDTVSAESSLIAFKPPPQPCPNDMIEDTEDTVPYDVDTYMEPGSPELIPSVTQQLPSPGSIVGKERIPFNPSIPLTELCIRKSMLAVDPINFQA